MKKEQITHIKAVMESLKAKQGKLVGAKKLEESLKPTQLGVLLESELAQAEVILAAKDFISKFQKMAEDLAKMQAEALPLSDSMKETFGVEPAKEFEDSMTNAIQSSMDAIRAAKDNLSNSVLRLEGKEVPAEADIANDMATMGAEAGEEEDDLFGSEDSIEIDATAEEEPLGRGFKESFDFTAYGKKLLVKESLDSLVNWLFEDVAGVLPAAELPKFAGQIAAKSAKDPVALAGWIGKRKYNAGAKAQLASTLAGTDASVLDESKAHPGFEKVADKIASKQHISKGAASAILAKSSRDASAKAKKENPRLKRVEEHLKSIIDRNIAESGKGQAAHALAEAQSKFPLAEGSKSLAELFEEAYGLSPQAYSLKKARVVAEDAPLSPEDKKNLAASVSQIASNMQSDKNLGQKGIQQSLSKMDAQERNTANKVINNAKSDGKTVNTVNDYLDITKVDTDKNAGINESDEDGDWVGRVEAYGVHGPNSKRWRKSFKDAAVFRKWAKKHEGDYEVHGVTDEVTHKIDENINAANWPVETTGQYKGKPLTTENNLKAGKETNRADTAPVKETPKGADAPSAKTPWDIGDKDPAEKPIIRKGQDKQEGTPLAVAKSKADTTAPSSKTNSK